MNGNNLLVPTSLRCLLVMLLAIGTASSQQPKLLWQDTVDLGNFDQAFDVDAINNRVFVVGFVGTFQNRDFLVRAYDADSGNLLWQDRVNNGINDYAAGVVAEGTTVFVSGATGTACCPDWLVRAYDARNGRLLWEDRFDRSGMADAPRPGALAVSNGLLFVVGHSNNFHLWVVRAYDTANGTLVWQDQFAEGPGLHGAESLVVEHGRVFVGGFGNSASSPRPGASAATIVRAYDARTGTVLWQQKTSGPDAGFTTLRGLGSDGLRVFAGGTVANSSGKNVMLVQAWDAQDGALVWEDRVDNGGVFDAANGIAVRGLQVFVQGYGGPQCLDITSPPSDCAILLRSYDAQTGALLWDVKTGTVGVDDQSTSQTLHAQGGTLFGAWGVNAPTAGPQGDWLVQAYETSSGQLRWEDLVDTGGGVRIQGAEIPLAVAMFGGRLFVAGRLVDSTDNWNFVVRAYHAAGLDVSKAEGR